MTQCSRKRDFRGGSISEFFNTIRRQRQFGAKKLSFPVDMAVTQQVSDACDAPPAEAGDLIQSIALLTDDRGGSASGRPAAIATGRPNQVSTALGARANAVG